MYAQVRNCISLNGESIEPLKYPDQPLSRFLLLQEGDPKELARLPVECAVDYY